MSKNIFFFHLIINFVFVQFANTDMKKHWEHAIISIRNSPEKREPI